MNELGASAEMPKYRCHKEVWALKIEKVNEFVDGTAELLVENPFSPISVDANFMQKHRPESGGYYVVYADGYKSFSPAMPFEAGYTRL